MSDISISTWAELILHVRDKIPFDGDDTDWNKVRHLFEEEELRHDGKHPVYHLQFESDAEYTRGDGKGRAKGRYFLWRRVDWELDYAKQLRDKAAAELRIDLHDSGKELFSELCENIATAMNARAGDDIIKSFATIIIKTRNVLMAKEYGVNEELITKLWKNT